MIVLDLNNPSRPLAVGRYETELLVRGLAASSNYAFVTDWVNGLHVIELGDPASPKRVGTYRTSAVKTYEEIAVSEGYAYIACGENGLHIIDLANPAEPQLAAVYVPSGPASFISTSRVQVSGNYLYVEYWAGGPQGDILDISDRRNPRRVGSFSGGKVSEGRAFGVDHWDHVSVTDYQDPTNPRFLASFVFDYLYPDDSLVIGAGKFVYVLSGSGTPLADPAVLEVVDIGDPREPRRLAKYETRYRSYDLALSGSLVYVADELGLLVIDVSNPTKPRELGRHVSGGYARGVAVSGRYAYVADGVAGLQVIDVGDPASPQRVATVPVYASANDIAVSSNRVFVKDEAIVWDSMNGPWPIVRNVVVDISQPTRPQLVATNLGSSWAVGLVDRGTNGREVVVSGAYAYQLTTKVRRINPISPGIPPGWTYSVTLFDMSDPARPTSIGSYSSYGEARALGASANVAYVAEDSGLQIIDFISPAQPRKVGVFKPGAGARSVAVRGQHGLLVKGDSVMVLNLSDPKQPLEAASFPIIHWFPSPAPLGLTLGPISTDDHVVIVGRYGYVAAGPAGLQLFEMTAPPTSLRLQTWPSPRRGKFHFVIAGEPGDSVTIQRSADLGFWEDWRTTKLDNSPIGICDTVLGSPASSWYRARGE
ncbi:MAG: hypothetical protein HYY24_18565 [Verrucomicrobia bacterium]|nr:hypothetical protein [Verrucomicrobiota bacterium]